MSFIKKKHDFGSWPEWMSTMLSVGAAAGSGSRIQIAQTTSQASTQVKAPKMTEPVVDIHGEDT